MDECLFCKIVRREVPAYIFYEDEKTVAFLDINPRSKGMSIVIPRKHYSFFYDDLETSIEVVKRSLLIAKSIKDILDSEFIDIAILPSQVKHFHVRIYPISNLQKEIPLIENKPLQVTEPELNMLYEKFRSIEVEFEEKKEEEKKEKEEEPKKARYEKRFVEWLKRKYKIG